MSFSLLIPTTVPNTPLNITIDVGEILFILGANGTGKSSLMQAFASAGANNTRRITAHRQTWFRSGYPEFAGKQRADYESNVLGNDQQTSSRWMDNYSDQRPQMAIYDLVNSENVRARGIARAIDAKMPSEVVERAAKEGALSILNRLLILSNLDIVVSIETNGEITAIRNKCNPYSIAKLSDGERNAILIAANVLTVPPGTLLLIDEPERHLHRSIVSPLLSLLLKERMDCAFLVSTHEPMLPIDNPHSKVLLTRACVYGGDTVISYDIDLLAKTDAIDDDLKRAILGERRKIVFVEGVEQSLDKPLYSLLFPNASIVAKANCREVESAVVGIKNTAELHWVKPFGLVDNDSSDPERIADLQLKSVTAISVYSVESIYYHPVVQKLAGEKISAVLGGNLEVCLKKANADAIRCVVNSAKHLSDRIAEKTARAQVFSLLPKKGEIANGGERIVKINFAKFARDEASRLEALVNVSDFIGVLQRYPIRETPSLDAIAKALNFTNRDQYEAAVRKLLIDDPEAVKIVRSLLGLLPADLLA